MARTPRNPFQRTVSVPRIDPDFDSWMDAWMPRTIQERARRQADA